MNATREVLYGSVLLTFFSIVAGAVAYLTKIVLVQNLSVEEFGLFFSVLTLILFLQVFISLGLPTGLARTIAKFRVTGEFAKIKSIIMGSFGVQMSMALLVMIVLFVLSDFLASSYFENGDAKWLLLVLSLYFPLNVLRSQFGALFNGFSKSLYLALMQFLYNVGVFCFVLVGLYVFGGIKVPVFAYLGGFLVVFLVLFIPFFKTFNVFSVRGEEFKKSNKELLVFSAPLLFTVIGGVFISYFDTLMLTYYETLIEVGVYNIVLPTALLLVLVGSSVGVALLPVITRLFEEGKKGILSNAFSKVYVYVGFVVIPAIVVLMLLSSYIIEIFFGGEYLLGLVAFNVLVLGSLFKIFMTIQNQALVGVGKSSSILKVFTVGALSNVVLNMVLIPLYSLTGAAIATSLSYVLMFVISYYLLRKEFVLNFPIYKFLLLIGCSLSIIVSVEIFWMLSFNMYILTALGLIVGGGLYLGLVLLFRVIDVVDFLEMFGVDIKDVFEKIKRRRIM